MQSIDNRLSKPLNMSHTIFYGLFYFRILSMANGKIIHSHGKLTSKEGFPLSISVSSGT